jgi:hypothetical protein
MSSDGGFQAVRAAGENLQIRTLFFKKKSFLYGKILNFSTIWWKAPFWLVGNPKKKKKEDGNFGDSARGQANPRSVAVYTMDRPGRVICTYVCVGTCNDVPIGHRDVPLAGLDPSSALPVGLMMPIRHGLFGRVS